MQLAKDAASAEKGQQNSNACRQHTLVRLRRFLGDTLDYIDGALIQKVAHLFRHFLPGPGGVVAEKETDDCQEQENQRREREHSVVGECSSQLRYFVVQPFRKRLFQQAD